MSVETASLLLRIVVVIPSHLRAGINDHKKDFEARKMLYYRHTNNCQNTKILVPLLRFLLLVSVRWINILKKMVTDWNVGVKRWVKCPLKRDSFIALNYTHKWSIWLFCRLFRRLLILRTSVDKSGFGKFAELLTIAPLIYWIVHRSFVVNLICWSQKLGVLMTYKGSFEVRLLSISSSQPLASQRFSPRHLVLVFLAFHGNDARRGILFWLFVHHSAGLLATASCRGFLWHHIAALLVTAFRRDFLWHLVAASPPRHLVCCIIYYSTIKKRKGMFMFLLLLFYLSFRIAKDPSSSMTSSVNAAACWSVLPDEISWWPHQLACPLQTLFALETLNPWDHCLDHSCWSQDDDLWNNETSTRRHDCRNTIMIIARTRKNINGCLFLYY